MDISDLDLEKAEILVRHGKGDKRRTVPLLNKDLVVALAVYISGHGEDKCTALFKNERGTRISRSALSSRLSYTLQRAGLKDKGYTLHSFRHYFMTHMLNEGYKIHQVQKWAGHADPSMILKTYAHVTEDIENAHVAAKRESNTLPGNMIPMPMMGVGTAMTPPVVYIQVGGSAVPLPVLGTILLVSGEAMMATVSHQPAA
jgi:integrase